MSGRPFFAFSFAAIAWSRLALLAAVPSAAAVTVAVALGAIAAVLPAAAAIGNVAPGIILGALAILPVNLAAVVITAQAFAFSNAGSATAGPSAGSSSADSAPAIAFAGVILGMVVRFLGTVLIALATFHIVPDQLAATLATVCVLLLAVLAGETLLHARRRLAPSTPESARV